MIPLFSSEDVIVTMVSRKIRLYDRFLMSLLALALGIKSYGAALNAFLVFTRVRSPRPLLLNRVT